MKTQGNREVISLKLTENILLYLSLML